MKSIKYIFLLLVGAFIFNACSDQLEEINTNPNALTEVDLRLMMPEAIVQSFFNLGTNPARVSGLIMKQFEGLDAQQFDYMNYNITTNAMDNYWNTGLYSGALRSCSAIIEKVEAEGDGAFYSGLAKVLMANQYGIATSMFGDIPQSEALLGLDVSKPNYDSQESVYAAVQALLDEGIADLGASDPANYAGGDLVFGGDPAAWIATAQGLKARFYMHTSKRTGDYASALSALNASFTSLDAQPNLQFETSATANHALAKFGTERPGTLGFHPEFAAMLDGDPRADSYFGEGFDYFVQGTTAWGANDATLPLISFVELKIIQAEIMTRNGMDASSVLEEAINASLTQIGLDDEGAYAAANSSLAGLSMDAAIEQIMTEAYKAYYGYNFTETWTNYRRTGYPAITPQNNTANGLNPGGLVPRRFLYADTEFATNSDNVEAAIMSQGGDPESQTLDTDVWAFQ